MKNADADDLFTMKNAGADHSLMEDQGQSPRKLLGYSHFEVLKILYLYIFKIIVFVLKKNLQKTYLLFPDWVISLFR